MARFINADILKPNIATADGNGGTIRSVSMDLIDNAQEAIVLCKECRCREEDGRGGFICANPISAVGTVTNEMGCLLGEHFDDYKANFRHGGKT